MCRQGAVSDRQRQGSASADRDQRLTGRGLGAARTGASRCQARAPGLRLTAIAALAIGFTGVSGTASMPVREHCGPDGHRNAWGRCPTDCDTARPNGTAIFGALAFGTLLSTAGPASAPIAAGSVRPRRFLLACRPPRFAVIGTRPGTLIAHAHGSMNLLDADDRLMRGIHPFSDSR